MNPFLLMVGAALAAPPALSDWLAAYGEPTRPVAETDGARNAGEPLMLFWMSVEAAPIGAGPALPGTLVANFAGVEPTAALVGITFLAVATEGQADTLVADLRERGWVQSEQRVEREGGDYLDLAVHTGDGLTGVVSRRLSSETGATMADGRPAPTVWMTLSAADP